MYLGPRICLGRSECLCIYANCSPTIPLTSPGFKATPTLIAPWASFITHESCPTKYRFTIFVNVSLILPLLYTSKVLFVVGFPYWAGNMSHTKRNRDVLQQKSCEAYI